MFVLGDLSGAIRYLLPTVAVPPFEGGFLPVGAYAGPFDVPADDGSGPVLVETRAGHVTTPAEIHQRFVLDFHETATRQALHHELTQLLALLDKYVWCALYLVSGGFVTAETNPTDIHVAVILTPTAFAHIAQPEAYFLNRLLDDRQAHFGGGELTMFTDLAWVFPHGHPQFDDTINDLARIRYMCGHPAGDNRVAGYVQFSKCKGGVDAEILEFFANAVATP